MTNKTNVTVVMPRHSALTHMSGFVRTVRKTRILSRFVCIVWFSPRVCKINTWPVRDRTMGKSLRAVIDCLGFTC